MFLMDVLFEETQNTKQMASDTFSSLLFAPEMLVSPKLNGRTQHQVQLNPKREGSSSQGLNRHEEYHRQFRQDLGVSKKSAPSAYQPRRKRDSLSSLQISMSEIGRSLFL